MPTRRSRIVVAAALLMPYGIAYCGSAEAQGLIGFGDPPTFLDLGNITSSGTAGRQLFVEPTDPSHNFAGYRFFALFEPAPPSPEQGSIRLTADESLTVVIPQLQHFPQGASVSVGYSIADHEIIVNASMHLYDSYTATIYGPHEYLLPIGGLDSGDYRLILNLDLATGTGGISETGYALFSVQPVPEPASSLLMMLALAAAACTTRLSRRFL